MAERSRVAKVTLFSGAALLMLWVFLVSGVAGLVVIVVVDFIETYPRFGFLSRLVLYYIVVLPASAFLAKGITYLTPRRPSWLKYALFGIGVLGGSYFLFFHWPGH